jgi:cathepsin F
MNTKIFITLALLALSLATQLSHEKESYIFAKFQQFMKDHNKNYNTIEEYISRFNTFKQNYQEIESFYLENDEKVYHEVGINQFSDMTFQEFSTNYLNLKFTGANLVATNNYEIPTLNDLPESLDWRQKGAVSPVKDQKQCGSCWAFSTVGNLEGLYQIKTGNLVTFSEQQLVDCDKVDQGCNGGLMENAFKYIEQAGGLETDKDYSYKGIGGKCNADKSKSAVKVHDYYLKQDVSPQDYKTLLQNGPQAIAINANSFFQYTRGILKQNKRQCNPNGLNHGVTAVGYGVASINGEKVEYVILKNSWGPRWGEDGFIRVANDGTCGVNKYVSSAILETKTDI